MAALSWDIDDIFDDFFDDFTITSKKKKSHRVRSTDDINSTVRINHIPIKAEEKEEKPKAARSRKRGTIAEITPHLYLSGVHEMEHDVLKELGVTSIINCTADYPNQKFPFVENYVQIHVDDVPGTDLKSCFDMCADEIKKERMKGGATLVHCERGISRSSTLCIAYLMKCLHMSLFDAHQHVKSRRPCTNPNMGFFRQLMQFEKSLFGTNSVKIEPLK
ncbi:dual specificity protein phosphatase 14-like isoform X2 [Lingula anatina]|uniref:Dual specificity protein phosphatase 14-like isoform X2 n=1 Tax=Lingula anatina TaxID=7574 RepID=A0A1S3HLG0_LINAN|nr:dual specificity protein phosphatase 14-like isoform X2 [Lingula anatina]|eukprot:XP_013385849.1 dual specificity protein phosphatase 14-like isoform X2 [Lingula anatina]